MFKMNGEKILKEHKHKELLGLYRKTLTAISKMNFKELQVELSANFKKEDFDFSITVFNRHSDNTTFTFYDFSCIKKIKSNLAEAVDIIKRGDFDKIKELNLSN